MNELREWKAPKTKLYDHTVIDEKMLSKLTTSQNAAIRLHKDLMNASTIISQITVDEDNNSADGQGRGVLLNAKSSSSSEETGHQVGISMELKERLVQELSELLPKVEQLGDKLSETANNSSLWEAYRKDVKRQQAEEAKRAEEKKKESKKKKEIEEEKPRKEEEPKKKKQVKSTTCWNTNTLKPPEQVNYAAVASGTSSPLLTKSPSKSPVMNGVSSPPKKILKKPTTQVAQQLMDLNLGTNVIGVNNPVYTPPPTQHTPVPQQQPHAFHQQTIPMHLPFGTINEPVNAFYPEVSHVQVQQQQQPVSAWGNPQAMYSRFQGNSTHPRNDVDFVSIDRESSQFVPIDEYPLPIAPNSSLWSFSGNTGTTSAVNGASWSTYQDHHDAGLYSPFYPVDAISNNAAVDNQSGAVFYDNFSAFSNSPFALDPSIAVKGPPVESNFNAIANEQTRNRASQPCAVCGSESMVECNFCSGLRRKGVLVPATFFCDSHLSSSTWKEHQKVHEQYS